jgi:hypothetical protein
MKLWELPLSKLAAIVFILGLISAAHASCLDDAAKFAENVCGAIENEGYSSTKTLTGNVEAKTDGVLSRALAASGNVSLGVKTDGYKGVIREQLGFEKYDARGCRQKMALEATKQCPHSEFEKKPRYSHFVSAPTLVGKDISLFQSLPKKSEDNGELTTTFSNVSEILLVDGHEQTVRVDVIYQYFRNWLRRIKIFSLAGAEDCNNTQELKLMLGFNQAIWGAVADTGEQGTGPLFRKVDGPKKIKGTYYAYYHKKDSELTLWVNWYENPTHRYNNSTYECVYENEYREYCLGSCY